MVNVSVMGVAGRMGRSILNLLNQDSEIDIVGATEAPGHGALGADAGTVAGIGDIGKGVLSYLKDKAVGFYRVYMPDRGSEGNIAYCV